jgi:hypothetical protein
MKVTKTQLRRIIREEKRKVLAENRMRSRIRRRLLEQAGGARVVTYTTANYSDEDGPAGASGEVTIRDDEEHPEGGFTWGEISDDDLVDELYHNDYLEGPPEDYDIKRV